MNRIIGVLIAATLTLAPSAVHAEEPPTVLVIGDSITARYNTDPYSAYYGWWARTAYAVGMTPVTDAVNSSGMQVPQDCAAYSTAFPYRLGKVAAVNPDMIWVEGGRNDMYRCLDSRHRVVNDRSIAYAGIEKYMKALAVEVDKIGLPHSKVFVLTPWGTKDAAWGSIIQNYVKYLATAQGFVYAPIAVMGVTSTLPDLVHPNAMGSRGISKQLLAVIP